MQQSQFCKDVYSSDKTQDFTLQDKLAEIFEQFCPNILK